MRVRLDNGVMGLRAVVVGALLTVSWSVAVTWHASAAGLQAGGKIDPATVGAIAGKVTLEGTPPKNEPIRMNADPNCVKATQGQPQLQETYMVGAGGGLQHVFVHVKDGLGKYAYDKPAAPVTLDQRQCRYHPHVFGIRVGQPLEILNSDMTLHNIHSMPDENTEFNIGQPVQGMKTNRTFTTPEVMVPIRCDVHGWMNAYAGVVDHPFFAVSGPDGSFEIKGLPPGKYTIEAWHERLPAITQQVTLAAKENRPVSITFKVGG
jgi:plastocyanin